MSQIRTSYSHPLQIAEVRASSSHGRIGITFCPGKHDKSAYSGFWQRDLQLDLDCIRAWGATLVLTLVETVELEQLNVSELGQEVQQRHMLWKHLPIADFSIPSDDFEKHWHSEGREIRQILRNGKDIVIHCKGGLGRAGMIAARLLVELGLEPEQAIQAVRKVRRGAIETPSQVAIVHKTQTQNDEI